MQSPFLFGAIDGTRTHMLAHTPLKRTCLPVPPRSPMVCDVFSEGEPATVFVTARFIIPAKGECVKNLF